MSVCVCVCVNVCMYVSVCVCCHHHHSASELKVWGQAVGDLNKWPSFNYKLIREICTSVFITLFSVIVFNIFMEYSIIFSHSSFIVSLFMKFIFFAFIFIVFSCLFKVSYYINLIKMKGIT